MYTFSRLGSKAAFVSAFALLASLFVGATSYQELYFKGLWSRVNPSSFRDLLFFFHLYPDQGVSSSLSQKAYENLNQIMSFKEAHAVRLRESLLLSLIDIPSQKEMKEPLLNELGVQWVEALAKQKLQPRSQYYQAKSLDDLLQVDSLTWDLSQVAWLASAYPHSVEASEEVMRQYYAHIDLLALSALFAIEQEPVEKQALIQTKLEKLNQIIFQEQEFEFPPLLDHESQIDKYTSVPSLLSSKKGVCLGVSVLYLAIAQRLGLNLEMVTPPGHIYLSMPLGAGVRRNIETTASGMDLPEEIYRPLEQNRLVYRNIRELPGLILMNSASVLLTNQRFAQATKIYDKAIEFFNPETSFFIREFNMICQWLSHHPAGLQNAQKLLIHYQNALPSSLITWDPLLLEEVVKGVVGEEPVRLVLSSSSDEPSVNQKLLIELTKLSSKYPASKWLKSQMAIAAWKLNQGSRAYFLWPYGASEATSFLWLGARLSMQVGQLDKAMECMTKLETQLSLEDKEPMTPFTRAYVELCTEAVLKKN